LHGNPADSTLFEPALLKVIEDYKIIPRDSVTDRGYASKKTVDFALENGFTNIVFNKIVRS
jgi:IS5 family transposase